MVLDALKCRPLLRNKNIYFPSSSVYNCVRGSQKNHLTLNVTLLRPINRKLLKKISEKDENSDFVFHIR